MHPIDPVRVYDVQRQARGRLFEWVRPLTAAQYTRPFPFGLATLQATLIEMARSEHYYALRLREQPIPPFDETYPISLTRQPAFADLEAVWEPQMDWVRTAQLLLHDVHHRAQAMAIYDTRLAPGPGRELRFTMFIR